MSRNSIVGSMGSVNQRWTLVTRSVEYVRSVSACLQLLGAGTVTQQSVEPDTGL